MLQRTATPGIWRTQIIALCIFILSAIVFTSQPTVAVGSTTSYYPVGPQRNVPITTLTDAGWVRCFSETWDSEVTRLSTIQASCSGSDLILTGRPVGASVLTLLAAAPRATVFHVTRDNAPMLANGSWWYYTPVLSSQTTLSSHSGSIGFSDSRTIRQTTCDYPAAPLRLCWHIGYGDTLISGYQMDGVDLNGSSDFLREVYMLGGGCGLRARARERCRPTR
jgi:hypothetical protein